jgi:hypothetical protein
LGYGVLGILVYKQAGESGILIDLGMGICEILIGASRRFTGFDL